MTLHIIASIKRKATHNVVLIIYAHSVFVTCGITICMKSPTSAPYLECTYTKTCIGSVGKYEKGKKQKEEIDAVAFASTF